MTDHERQIMHDHHIAMRRTCLAQAAEHEQMAKVYEEMVILPMMNTEEYAEKHGFLLNPK
jgi:hypothetical protein